MSSPNPTTSNSGVEEGQPAYVGLGSNLPSRYGSPQQTVDAALERLASWSGLPLQRSSLWRTAPIDCPPGSPPFINAVAALWPAAHLTSHALLQRLLELELEFGRQRAGIPNAPRCLDLDLICFGDRQVADADLVLPHPLAHQRGFVMLPLAEIAPQLRLPGHRLTVSELAGRLAQSGPLIEKIDP
ncbi:MAG: 2-amino-4-hydroxy-6-hydroxymethyldihydropteridine diphosphokinase [Gammaproteobacteria bacterium]|nr:2-amino-4-hydroxy-6-hydroxymethyldihydropteridine diphosphokinase [Pseudomonadales bacterium]MCP5347275.1 2-amino-4-hydroxy-6-hydroxymethyldihydropteridine diphosphokinase [Pseudomonadales bacterium]